MEEKEIKLSKSEFIKIHTLENTMILFHYCNNIKFKIINIKKYTLIEIFVSNELLSSIPIKDYEIKK